MLLFAKMAFRELEPAWMLMSVLLGLTSAIRTHDAWTWLEAPLVPTVLFGTAAMEV